MSDHIEHETSHKEGGTIGSYIVGFILSLVCTLIPYYLVTQKVIEGSQKLLFVILAFAFVQVVIQVVFFLHLGRGPKPRWNLYFFVATLAIVAMVVGGSMLIINNLHYNMSPQETTKKVIDDEAIAEVGGKKTGACDELGENHVVYITHDEVSPIHTDAKQCDTFTFINEDGVEREMAFGVHPKHKPYAGIKEFPLTKKKNYTITLSETGTYQFHDHDHPDTFGTITITVE